MFSWCRPQLDGSMFPSTCLVKVRDWSKMGPSSVTFKNAFRPRKWTDDSSQTPLPHSFSFLPRSGNGVK